MTPPLTPPMPPPLARPLSRWGAAALLAAIALLGSLLVAPTASAAPTTSTTATTHRLAAADGNPLIDLLGLFGSLFGSPSLGWSPTTGGTYDYGTINAGSTTSQTFTLSNSGKAASGALKVTLAGSSAFTVTTSTCAGKRLGPKKTCTVTVRYAPTAPGAGDTATLAASSRFPKASATITLTGTALAADPHFTYSSKYDLTAVYTRFCVVTVNVTNLPAGSYHLVYNRSDGSIYDRDTFSSAGPAQVHTQTETSIPEGTTWTAQVLDETTRRPFGPPSDPIVVSC
jgi:hypothetical protein